MDVVIGWCTEFVRSGGELIRPSPLRRASRPPALFFHQLSLWLSQGGHPLNMALFADEDLGEQTLTPGANLAVQSADLVFLSSHGRNSGEFRMRLRRSEWTPATGPHGAAVMVLGTCDLVAAGETPAQGAWLQAGRPGVPDQFAQTCPREVVRTSSHSPHRVGQEGELHSRRLLQSIHEPPRRHPEPLCWPQHGWVPRALGTHARRSR